MQQNPRFKLCKFFETKGQRIDCNKLQYTKRQYFLRLILITNVMFSIILISNDFTNPGIEDIKIAQAIGKESRRF